MQELTVYEPGQVKVIYPYLGDWTPSWFLLGGPADASEAQDFRRDFPNTAIIGFEPNPYFFNLQLARGFPGRLLPYALWSELADLEIKTVSHEHGFWMEQRSGSVSKFNSVPEGDRKVSHRVKAWSLNELSKEFGPFVDAVLWIDIEEAELDCLRGATRLLEQGAIRLINAEVHDYRIEPMANFLDTYDIHEVGRWNANTIILDDGGRRDWYNIIYRRDV